MGRGVAFWYGFAWMAALSLESCAVYPTSRTFYEPNADDGSVTNRGSCGYMTTHDAIERNVGGVVLKIFIGDEDEPSGRPDTLDVHITASHKEDGTTIDQTKVTVSAEGDSKELHGNFMPPVAAKLGLKWQDDPRYLGISIQYPAPAGTYDAIVVKFASGALRLHGQTLDVQPFRFHRVKKHDVYYGSINC